MSRLVFLYAIFWMFLEGKLGHPFLEGKGGQPVQNLLQVTFSAVSFVSKVAPQSKRRHFILILVTAMPAIILLFQPFIQADITRNTKERSLPKTKLDGIVCTLIQLRQFYLDLQIAAIAVVNNLTLVMHNTREFSRVSGLVIEDWEQR